ncbi:hypothetical protein [Nostoc sp. CHAB 5836]|uniref:hypothetical protein n=1 Tax=Nostoc sp. CHAB 5836 TaxID=2780404 RepID=UPI001E643F99|nr:hypothetical protein [Nostoc sp. CHAB 5836]
MDVSKNALGGFFTDIITGSKSAGEASLLFGERFRSAWRKRAVFLQSAKGCYIGDRFNSRWKIAASAIAYGGRYAIAKTC